MKKKKPRTTRDAMASTRKHEHEAEGGVAGALAGAVIGAVGGPPGAAVGAVLGGIVGAVAAGVVETNSADRASLERELDAESAATRGTPVE